MDRNLRIRMLLEAGDRVTKPLRDIAGGSNRTAQALKATRDRLKEIDRAQADIAGFRELKAGLRSTETELKAAQTRVGQLARAIAQTDSPTRKMTAEFAKAKREAAALKREHGEQSTRLQELRTRLSAAGIATSNLAQHERRLRGEASRTNEELAEQERRLRDLTDRGRRMSAARAGFDRIQGRATALAAGGFSGVATGRAMATPLLGSVRGAMEYQSVMTDIAQKANLSREDARAMGLGLLVAAKAANQLPEALQQGVDTLAGFGLDPRKAVAMMRPIGRAATAYKAEIADLSSAAFAANDNLKVPVEQTARVIDVMAQAGKSGAFEIKDMAQYFPTLTAAAQGLGQKGVPAVADLAAALQIARKGAGDSATAANNVANLLQKVTAPGTVKKFKEFGVDLPAALQRAYKEGKTPIEAIAELTNKTLKGDLSRLGFLFEDAQVQQALRPLIQNIDEYKRIRADAFAAKGVTDTDFAERLKDGAEQSKKFAIQAKILGLTMGAALLPTATRLLEKLTGFSSWLGDMATRFPNLAKWLGLSAGGFALLLVVFGGLAIATAGLLAPFAALNVVAVGLGVGLLPVIAIAAGVVAGIVAIATAVYLIYKNWGAITGFFGKLWEGIKSGVAGIFGFLVALPLRFAEFGRNLILGMINGITGMLGALKSTIVGAASSAATWFKNKLGIRSPSRVFAGFGGYMMEGLANGIHGGAAEPIRRIDGLSRQLTRALAVGMETPAIAASAVAGGTPSGGGVAGGTPAPITIHIHAAPGQSPQDIAAAVSAELDRRERGKAAASRSAFREDQVGSAY